LIDYSWR